MTSKWIMGALPLGLALLLAAGCTHRVVPTAPLSEAQEAKQTGADIAQNGIMTQADYVKVDGLGHQVAASHTISEADLDWDLAFLQRSSTGIARARALTVISEINPVSDAQKAKISPVVTPLLNSPDPLTRQYAQRVQRHGGLL